MRKDKFIQEIQRSFEKDYAYEGMPYGILITDLRDTEYTQIIISKKIPHDFFDENVDSTLIAREWGESIVKGQVDFLVKSFIDNYEPENIVSIERINNIDLLFNIINNCHQDGINVTDIFIRSEDPLLRSLYNNLNNFRINPERIIYGLDEIRVHRVFKDDLKENMILAIDRNQINWFQKRVEDMKPLKTDVKTKRVNNHEFLDIKEGKMDGSFVIAVRTVISLEFFVNSGRLFRVNQ